MYYAYCLLTRCRILSAWSSNTENHDLPRDGVFRITWRYLISWYLRWLNDKLGKVCRELIHSLQNRAGSDYNDRMVRYQRSSAVEQRHYESSISGWLINFLHLLAECSASFSPGNGKFQRPTFLLSDFSIELTIHLLLHLKFTHFWIMRLMKNCLIQKLCGLIQIV